MTRSIFRPTFLCVKIHNKTGLKYFCKTTKSDPYAYDGSGVYWRRHIKKHGRDITTQVIGYFKERNICERFALDFSRIHNIIESNEWANLIYENGLDGGSSGPHTEERKTNISKAKRGKTINLQHTQEFKEKISELHKGKVISEETKEKLRNSVKIQHNDPIKRQKFLNGIHNRPPHRKVSCIRCRRVVSVNNFDKHYGGSRCQLPKD